MNVLYWILPLLLLFPLLWLARLLFMAKLLMSMRLHPQRVEGLELAELPQFYCQAFSLNVHPYIQDGFRARQAFHYSGVLGSAFEQVKQEFVDESLTVRLHLIFFPEANLAGRHYPALCSTLSDGHELVTTAYQNTEILDHSCSLLLEHHPDLAFKDLHLRHRQRMQAYADQGNPALPIDTESAVLRENDLSDAFWTELHSTPGLCTLNKDGTLSFTFLTAFKRSFRALLKAKESKAAADRLARSPAFTTPLSPGVLLEFDHRQANQMEALQSAQPGMVSKILLTLGSLAVFAITLGWRMSPENTLALLVVLIFHELGHLAGMKLFGYKNTQLLFIPLLGGAAVSVDEQNLPPWKHLVIIFLGPLPGLCLSILGLILWDNPPEWGTVLIYTGIFLNAFNLLPVLPLDGGQVLDYSVTGRFPRLHSIFHTLSGAALGVTGLWILDSTMLSLLGLFMVLEALTKWNQAGLIGELRAELGDAPSKDDATRAILTELRQPHHDKQPWIKRLASVPSLRHRILLPKAGIPTMLFAFVTFLSPLWLGGGGALLLLNLKASREIARADELATAKGLLPLPGPNSALITASGPAWQELVLASRLYGGLAAKDPHYKILRSFREGGNTEAYNELVFALRGLARFPSLAAPADFDLFTPENKDILGTLSLTPILLSMEGDRLAAAGNTAKAADLAFDMLALATALRADSRLWTWHDDVSLRHGALDLLRRCQAKGLHLGEARLRYLLSATEEAPLLAYASRNLPVSSIMVQRRFRNMVALGLGEDRHASLLTRTASLFLFGAYGASSAYTDTIKRSIETREMLDKALGAGIDQFHLPDSYKARTLVHYQLQELLYDVAITRHARTAVLLQASLEKTGKAPASLSDLGIPAPLNPLNGSKLELRLEKEHVELAFPVLEQPQKLPAATKNGNSPAPEAEEDEELHAPQSPITSPWRFPLAAFALPPAKQVSLLK